MLTLLPLLVGSALQMQAPATTQEVEEALTDGVRQKLADGWTLVDVRGDYDEITLTVAKGTQVEAHVAHIDGKHNAYRIDAGIALPQERIEPTPFLLQALMTNGGLEIGGHCGHHEVRPYLLDASAKGAAASRLIARTLKQSRDVEGAHVENGRAKFALEMRDRGVELHVALEADIVVAAEVRQYEYVNDSSDYTKQSRMRRQLGSTVTSIVEDGVTVKLAGDKAFTIDLEHFERHETDGTCGC